MRDDHVAPDCTAVRESVSAQLDAEVGPRSVAAVRAHLAACPGCAAYEVAVTELHRRGRIITARPVPELSERIAATAEARGLVAKTRRRDRRVRDLRIVVGLAGVAQLGAGLVLLLGLGPGLLSEPALSSLHLARDLAALEIAVGVGLLLAAVQPRRAAGVLPVVAVVAGVALATAVVDLSAGVASPVGELTHLTELVGVVALWALTRRLPTPGPLGRVAGVT